MHIIRYLLRLSFNPRARDERDGLTGTLSQRGHVSIHALVMSATQVLLDSHQTALVSIHALVMSATCTSRSASPTGTVSIHALVMSATGVLLGWVPSTEGFNPRARDERDVTPRCCWLALRCFNPRARDERDFRTLRLKLSFTRFNPRARDERDFASFSTTPSLGVSIHALVMSAT